MLDGYLVWLVRIIDSNSVSNNPTRTRFDFRNQNQVSNQIWALELEPGYLELGVKHQFQTRLPRVQLELGLISRTITKIETWIFSSITRLEPDPRFRFFSWTQNHNCNKWHYVLRNLNVTKKQKKKQMD